MSDQGEQQPIRTSGFDPRLDLDRLMQRPGAKWGRHRGKVAAWIADMDWPVAPPVAARLADVLSVGDLGYPNWNTETWQSPMVDLFVDRMSARHGWAITADRCWEWADVIQAVRVTTDVVTAPGDRIVLHLPSYPPFLGTIDPTGRRGPEPRTLQPVHATTDGERWMFDYDRLETELADSSLPPARMWILCHPHNPLGHVFERDELERIADIAERFDLVVVSDEIHADLTYPTAAGSADVASAHLPFATISDDAAQRTVTVTSGSKAFNLAGLRWAVAHVGNDAVHKELLRFPSHFFGAPNMIAAAATGTAWTECDDWLAAVVTQLEANSTLLSELLATHLPAVRYTPNRATYLAWLDVHDHGPAASDSAAWFRSRGVELSNGADFGPHGAGHVRLNIGTDPAVLRTIVERLAT